MSNITIDDAIRHCLSVASPEEMEKNPTNAKYHIAVAEWLQELKKFRDGESVTWTESVGAIEATQRWNKEVTIHLHDYYTSEKIIHCTDDSVFKKISNLLHSEYNMYHESGSFPDYVRSQCPLDINPEDIVSVVNVNGRATITVVEGPDEYVTHTSVESFDSVVEILRYFDAPCISNKFGDKAYTADE